MSELEIRKDTQDFEIGADTPKAKAPEARKLAGIYPEADPRRFNARTTEQEVAEYVESDPYQKISSEDSVDKAHIHAARVQEPPKEKTYQAENWPMFILAIILTFLAILFMGSSVPMFIFAFLASLAGMPNFKLFPKTYKVLGFNPIKTVFILDIILAFIGFLYLVLVDLFAAF